jgi:ribosomal protein S18 acetylase RimI-like enzyme
MASNKRLSEKLVIRPYQKKDYDDTLQLMAEISESFDYYFDRDMWTESSGMRLIEPGYNKTTIVGELDGKVVAMGFIELVNDTLDGLNVGYLSNWGVKKEYRGSGVGTVLANTAINMLAKQNADAVRIKIAMNGDPSKVVSLVEKIGFTSKYIAVEKMLNPNKVKKAPSTTFKNPPIFF